MTEENKEKPKKPWDDIITFEFDKARRKEEIFKATLEFFKQNKKAQKYFQKLMNYSLKI